MGCGSKPYEPLFSVDDYVGIDIEVSGHDHASSKANKFYDGKTIPFSDGEFDWVFSSEVFEHVFNLDELLGEINRVLHKDGRLAFTCPFVWDEHEQPFDFARYTSFAIRDMMEKNGFEVEVLIKSTNHFETIMQMLSAYISQHCLPRNVYLRFLMYPIFGAPFNIVGCLLGKLLPKSENLYLNNVVIARKR